MASPVVVPPPPTTNIVASDLTPIGAFPISDQDKAQLALGKIVVLTLHTPRMLQQTMGPRNFSVELRQDLNGNVICDAPSTVTRAISHIAEASNMLSQMNAAIKNVKPDPNV